MYLSGRFIRTLIIFINDIDNKLLYLSILVFDLWYYNLDRFGLLADKNISASVYGLKQTLNGITQPFSGVIIGFII